jgi:WD40 repeat protein
MNRTTASLIVISALLLTLWPVEESFAFRNRMGARSTVKAIRMNTRQAFRPTFKIRSRFAGTMNVVGFSGDGKWFATGSNNKSAQLWSTTTGQRELDLRGHSGAVLSLAFIPDHGKSYGHRAQIKTRSAKARSGFLVSGDTNGNVRLWNLVDGETVRSFRGHSGPVNAVAVTPDGAMLTTAGKDGSVRLWNLASGQSIRTMSGHDGPVNALAIAPDGNKLVSGGRDGTVRIWNIASGSKTQELKKSGGGVLALAWSPDGKTVASGHKGGVVQLWSAQSGSHLKTLSGHNGAVNGVAFRADGDVLASVGADKSVRTWSVSGKKLQVMEGHQEGVRAVAFSPGHGGNMLLTGSSDRTARLWNGKAGSEIVRMVSMRSGWAVVAPDGRFDGTLDGDLEDRLDAIKWVGDGHSFSLDGFVERHYRPALLGYILAKRPETSLDPKVANVTEGFQLPPQVKVQIQNKQSSKQKKIAVDVRAEDMGGGIDEIRLYHNEKIVDPGKSAKKEKSKGRKGDIEKAVYNVELVDGKNVFRIVGLSNDRIESEPASASINYTSGSSDAPPKLHVFVVGINKYANNSMNLDFAVPDAKGVLDFFLLSYGGTFKKIITYEIYDKKATKSNISKGLKTLKSIQPQDTVILYFAGHGDSIKDSWFFLPHELKSSSEQSVQRQGVSSAKFKEHISQIGANKIVLLFDACKSGAAMDVFSEFSNKKSMALLSRSTGIHIATSTTGEQYASELPELGHGVFTYALLKGLKGVADKKPKDGSVTITEILGFITRYVPFLNHKYETGSQTPVVTSRGSNFVVYKKQ